MISPEDSQHGPDAYDEAAAETNPTPRPHGIGSKRPNTNTYTITNRAYLISIESRVGLTLDALLEQEEQDYRRALQSALDDGESAASFARGEEDRSVWTAAGELVALLRADRESGSLLALVIDPGIALPGWQVLVDGDELAAADDEGELADFAPDEPEAGS